MLQNHRLIFILSNHTEGLFSLKVVPSRCFRVDLFHDQSGVFQNEQPHYGIDGTTRGFHADNG